MKNPLQPISRALLTATLFAAFSSGCLAAPDTKPKPIVLDRLPADQIASRAEVLKNTTGAKLPDMKGGVVLRVGVAQTGETAMSSIAAAFNEAKKRLKDGTPVTIRIDAGTYREGELRFNGKEVGGQAAQTPLVIEGAAGGGTILTGAESYPLAKWKKIGDNLYETDWQKRIPMFDGPWGVGNPKRVVAHRREVLFLNDRVLHPFMSDVYNYKPRVASGRGEFSGRGTTTFIETLPPEKLPVDTFGVTDRTADKKVYLRTEKPLTASDNIEISVKPIGLDFENVNGLVLRNLTMQRYAVDMNQGALNIGDYGVAAMPQQNVTIENCHFRWNNGQGVQLGGVANLTFRNNSSTYNGFNGATLTTSGNILWEDVDTSFNNWRGHWANFYATHAGGVKCTFLRDAVFRRHTSIGNLAAGLWFDVDNIRIVIEDAKLLFNPRYALFLEISAGPFYLDNSILANDHGTTNVKVLHGQYLTAKNNIFYAGKNTSKGNFWYNTYNRTFNAQRMQNIMGETPVNYKFAKGTPMIMSGNVFVAETEGQGFYYNDRGDSELYTDNFETVYRGSNQLFYAPFSKNFGWGSDHTNNSKRISFAEWNKSTKEAGATFADPQFVDAANGDFTLKAGSPLQARADELPLWKMPPAKVRELNDFMAFAQFPDLSADLEAMFEPMQTGNAKKDAELMGAKPAATRPDATKPAASKPAAAMGDATDLTADLELSKWSTTSVIEPIDASNPKFEKAQRVTVKTKPDKYYNADAYSKIPVAFAKGDEIELAFWLRAPQGNGIAKVQFVTLYTR